MEFETFDIDGPILIKPKHFGDSRGYFMETFRNNWFRENISDVEFVQDNQSFSAQKGTIRGLHFQDSLFGQGKLVSCVNGEIFDVAVDIRPNSQTFGKWIAANISAQNKYQLWVPLGFAHGFCTLSDNCVVAYKVTQYYSAAHDNGIAYNDPDIAIDWPITENIILSDKDRKLPNLKEFKK